MAGQSYLGKAVIGGLIVAVAIPVILVLRGGKKNPPAAQPPLPQQQP